MHHKTDGYFDGGEMRKLLPVKILAHVKDLQVVELGEPSIMACLITQVLNPTINQLTLMVSGTVVTTTATRTLRQFRCACQVRFATNENQQVYVPLIGRLVPLAKSASALTKQSYGYVPWPKHWLSLTIALYCSEAAPGL